MSLAKLKNIYFYFLFFYFLVKWSWKCCIYWGVMHGMLAREEASENFPAALSELCFLKVMLSRSLWITASGIKEGVEAGCRMLHKWNSPGSYSVITFLFLNSLCCITFKMKLLLFLLAHGKSECSLHCFVLFGASQWKYYILFFRNIFFCCARSSAFI